MASDNLLNALWSLDAATDKDTRKYIRAPFGYIGGKYTSLKKILPVLPYRKGYIEPFGGSGVVLMNRQRSRLEVLNDRYAGIVAFYRCLRHPEKYKKLRDRLELTINSREEWVWCADTWETCEDDVERAARWYYMIEASFANIGASWGRELKQSIRSGKIKSKLPDFQTIHNRLRQVQIENLDFRKCIRDYDGDDVVFYIDPPYLSTTSGSTRYNHNISKDDHRDLLNLIMDTKGFVALSGYPNPLYDSYDWDDKITWDQWVSCSSTTTADGGDSKGHLDGLLERSANTECLWIKE